MNDLLGRTQPTIFEDHDPVHAFGNRVIVSDDDEACLEFSIEFEH